MDSDLKNLPPGDPKLIDSIVNQLKSQGIFDEFRRDCMADVDTKPAYQNLQHRVETFANDYLKDTQWRPDLNKNQLRDGLRKQITESGLLTIGVDRIIDQIVNPKIIKIFLPKITEIVHKLLGIEVGSSQNNTPSVSVSNGEGSQTSTSTRSAGINSNSSNETKSIVNKESVVNDGHPTNFIKIENKQDGEKTKEKLSAGTVIQDAKVNSDHDHSSPESNYHKEIDIKKEKSSGLKGDFKVGITRPDSSKKIEHVNKGVSDDKTKLKSVKKMDAKPENKLKLVTPEKVKFCDVKVKVEKMAKKDVIVIKSKGNDNKGQKSDEIHKDGTLENKDKKISAEKKPCSSKIPESQVKIKSEEHFKNKPEPHRVDDIPKTKKNESKEKDDLKSHKSLPKSKSFEDRDDGKSKLEKSIIDKGKEDASKKCGSSDSVKNDKNKDERPKSDSGKPSKPAELSKGEHKPKSDKLKSMEKRPESSKHKFSDKSDRSSETKLKLLERSKSSECVMRHEEGKVVLGDKKGINTSGHRKVKEFDKGAQEKHKSSSCEVKPKEAEIISSSKLKSINVFKTTCSSTKEEKGKVKKETDRESTKVKVDEKVQALSSFTKQVSYTDKSDNQEKYSDLKYDDKSHSQLIDEKSIDLEQTLQSKSLMNKHSSQAACKKYDSKDKLGKRKLSETGTESDDFLSTRKQKCEQNTSSSNFYSEDYTKDSSNEKRLGTMGNIPDGQLSDVTVSSVHTSDLSDFDDRISLSESDVDEVENSSSKKNSPMASQNKAMVKHRDSFISHKNDNSAKCEVFLNAKEKVEVADQEPRRELRRQRKLNPRYASDDFKSIFNTGKEKSYHGHPLDYAIDDVTRSADVFDANVRSGRRFTGSSITADENELPTSPISDVSEPGESTKSKRSEKSKWFSPSESSDGDHSFHDPRSSMSESQDGTDAFPKVLSQQPTSYKKGKSDRYLSSPTDVTVTSPKSDGCHRRDSTAEAPTNQKRAPRSDNQRYNDTDLYKPRPVFSSSRRRGASPTRPSYSSNYNAPNKDLEDLSQSSHNISLEHNTSRGRTHKTSLEPAVVQCGTKRSSENTHHSTSQKRRR